MKLKAQTWLIAGVAVLLLAGLAGLLAGPLRQVIRDWSASGLRQWNQVELDRFLAQHTSPTDTLATGTLASDPTTADVAIVASGPLRVSGVNRRYFADATGRIVYLTGSHTWASFQDNGNGNPPPAFDYNQYLEFLTANNHNFFRLWTWEQSRWTLETADDNYWFNPEGPYVRSGPGTALDGKAKWDLSTFDQAYFDRMRQRVIAAGQRGMYVSIMLFDGWSVVSDQSPALNNPWRGHPYNAANNVNTINGDVNGDNNGREVHTLANPAVTALQEAYVKKVIDTVNDLDNVLYEIANEAPNESLAWQYRLVDVIHTYEAAKPKQHPVGMTGRYEWSVNDLLASGAEWISPGGSAYQWEPPAADGQAVVIVDTDHLWGIGGDRQWVWKSFTRGLNPIFMDGYDGAGYGVGGGGFNFNDPQWVKLRANMGYTRAYAQQVNLAAATPRGDLCSTGFCLANPVGPGAEFLVYQPAFNTAFTVNLSGLSGSLAVEWLNPDNGSKTAGAAVNGGSTVNFTPPFASDAVLYLKQAGSPTPTKTPTPTPTPTATPKAQFPTSALLDNFNRPNSDMGVNWLYQPVDYGVANNRLAIPSSGMSIWQPNEFGSTQEAFVTFTSIDPAAQEVGVLLKGRFDNDNLIAGIVVGYLPASSRVRVSIINKQGPQPVSPETPVTFAPGDRLGARANQVGRVELFRNGSLLGSVDAGAALASSGGSTGVYIDYGNSSGGYSLLDNFGAGSATYLPPPGYRINVSTSVAGSGSVQVEPTGAISCGQRVTITAVAASGWQFNGWTGDVVENQNPLIFNLTGSLTLAANFIEAPAAQPYSVTVQTVGEGVVDVQPAGPYAEGQVVQVTAQADAGWFFNGWSGAQQGNRNPLHLQIERDTALTANFVPATNVYLPAIRQATSEAIGALAGCE